MRRIICISFFACLMHLAKAQIIHDPNASSRTVGDGFHAVEISDGIDLYLSEGEEAVTVSAKDEDVRNLIRTEVRDGILRIWFEWKGKGHVHIGGNKKLKAYVSAHHFDRLSAAGGSHVLVSGVLRPDSLQLMLSGGADFSGALQAGQLYVRQSGGSDLHLTGHVNWLHMEASGGSNFQGYQLETDVCMITASGGSDINITVNQALSASASGGSDIHWKGTAVVKQAHASGAGNISHKS